MTGEALMKGIAVHLPNEWLARGDGTFNPEFEDQQTYGSDILLLKRIP
jgi:hypothetical protein